MKKNLIVFYSWAGHTRKLAEYIQQFAGGDLLDLIPEEPYCDDYDVVVERAKEELEGEKCIAVKNLPENIGEYENIFVGSPNWWNTAAPAIYTFMNKYDFAGKKVIPFCAHGSKGCEKVNADILACAKGAEALEGFGTFGKEMNETTPDAVKAWLRKINLA